MNIRIVCSERGSHFLDEQPLQNEPLDSCIFYARQLGFVWREIVLMCDSFNHRIAGGAGVVTREHLVGTSLLLATGWRTFIKIAHVHPAVLHYVN